IAAREGSLLVDHEVVTAVNEELMQTQYLEQPGRAVFLGDDMKLFGCVQNTEYLPGYFDVVIHGDIDGFGIMRMVNGKEVWTDVSVQELADMIRASGWRPGQPIRLLSCNTGGIGIQGDYTMLRPGIAQDLAHELKADLIAPNSTLWFSNSGELMIN